MKRKVNQDIKFELIEKLKARGAYSHSVDNRQHYTRCPYCGDSTNLSHAHLSICIDVDTDFPMLYRCLKCDVHGMVTETTLEELDIVIDESFRKDLRSYNRKGMRSMKLVNMEFENYFVPLYTENKLNAQKLWYLNHRLGTDIDYTMEKDKKILLDLFDFMKANEMKTIKGLSYPMMEILNQYYIGFLSCNNNCITFRDITNSQKYRYFKVVLNPKNINPDTFYAAPNSIPALYTHDIHVHLAEGIFDILSIQENVVQKNDQENFYYATCGFGGITILKYLLHHGMNTGIHLHIYSDNDKTDWDHKRYLRDDRSYITEWIDHISIHRNQYSGEKDYGVPIDHIIDRSRPLK